MESAQLLASPTRGRSRRVPQLDLLKAIAILVVPLEHSKRSMLFTHVADFDDAPPTLGEAFVGDLSAACTPVFFYVSHRRTVGGADGLVAECLRHPESRISSGR